MDCRIYEITNTADFQTVKQVLDVLKEGRMDVGGFLHAIDLRVLSAKGQKSRAYQGHRVLTNIHHSEGTSFTISKRPAKSHPLSTGSISCSGLISPWRWYFPGNTGLAI